MHYSTLPNTRAKRHGDYNTRIFGSVTSYMPLYLCFYENKREEGRQGERQGEIVERDSEERERNGEMVYCL